MICIKGIIIIVIVTPFSLRVSLRIDRLSQPGPVSASMSVFMAMSVAVCVVMPAPLVGPPNAMAVPAVFIDICRLSVRMLTTATSPLRLPRQ